MTNIFEDYGNAYNSIDESMNLLKEDIQSLEDAYNLTFNEISGAIDADNYEHDNMKRMNSINIENKISSIQTKLIEINAKIRSDLNVTNMDNTINDYISLKTDVNSSDPATTYQTDIDSLVSDYNELKEKLHSLYSEYNKNVSVSSTNTLSRKYYLMFVWIIILIILLGASFVSIVDENKSMNIFVRFILFTVLAVIVYNTLRNITLFASGHSLIM